MIVVDHDELIVNGRRVCEPYAPQEPGGRRFESDLGPMCERGKKARIYGASGSDGEAFLPVTSRLSVCGIRTGE